MTAVLEVSDIHKRFGGITAVDGVSFDVQEGEILGLIGRTAAVNPRCSTAFSASSRRAAAR